MTQIAVPRWGLTMEEAMLTAWHVSVGDEVTEGQAVAVLETDKTENDIESPASGRVVELLARVGQLVEPGQVIALLTQE